MKLKKPPMKRPEPKVPAFLADLYYDLRDRRLLPLIALVVVAIAAVPFLLGSSEPLPLPPAAAVDTSPNGSAGASASLAVVEAKPGLRDYRERLRGRTATDPFKQRYTGLPKSAQVESVSGGSESAGDSSPVVSVGEDGATSKPQGTQSGGSEGDASGGNGGGGESQPPRLIEFVFDVQISHAEETPDGGQKMSDPEVRRRVKTLAQLPSRQTPVVTLAGVNLHNGKVWFLVTDEVRSLDGDFTCATRTPAGLCELLEIESGFPLELTYGPDDVLYRIKVTKIDAVWAGKVGDSSRSSRAAFGVSGDLSPPTGSGSASK
jgi:hypothetical protein